MVVSPIGLDVLPLPEVLVENYGADVPTVLRPMFDALWQACGLEQSLNYNAQGNWEPAR
jgi:hypothetical protein